jgi:hypothetical protein
MKYPSNARGNVAAPRRRRLAAVLFGALAAAAFTAPAQITPSRPGSGDPGYAEPETCAVCPRGTWETYRQTGMGRSFYRPLRRRLGGPSGSLVAELGLGFLGDRPHVNRAPVYLDLPVWFPLAHVELMRDDARAHFQVLEQFRA